MKPLYKQGASCYNNNQDRKPLNKQGYVIFKVEIFHALMLKHYIVILLATICLSASCKKKQLVPTAEAPPGDATLSIYNTFDDSVYLSLDGSDIKTGTIPHIINIAFAAADSIVLTPAELRDGFSYRYTWHTANYKAGSWMNVDANGKFTGTMVNYFSNGNDTAISLKGGYRDELLVCLDGDGQSSTWLAVDAYNAAGVSVWDTLTEKHKQHSFIISSFHTVKHSFIDTANKQKSTSLAFSMNMAEPRVWLKVEHKNDRYVLTNNLSPIAPLTTGALTELYYTQVREDSTGSPIYTPPYYKLVRQSVER